MTDKQKTENLIQAWDKACKDVEKPSKSLDIDTDIHAGGVTFPPRW